MIVPGLITPGQRTSIGTRKPPSQVVPFSPVVRRRAAVRPRRRLRAVVGAVDDDGVVGDAEIVELLQHPADHVVVLDHAVGVEADAGAALGRLLQMRPDVHARGVEPDEERLVVLDRPCRRTSVRRRRSPDRRWACAPGERAGVLDLLPALAVAPRVQHAARAVLLPELGVLRVVVGLRLLLGVQVVEVAEELVEAVHRRQVRVAVAEVVLAELTGRRSPAA